MPRSNALAKIIKKQFTKKLIPSNSYTIKKLLAASAVSSLSLALYYSATEDLGFFAITSSMGTNFIISAWSGSESIDFINLISKKIIKHKQLPKGYSMADLLFIGGYSAVVAAGQGGATYVLNKEIVAAITESVGALPINIFSLNLFNRDIKKYISNQKIPWLKTQFIKNLQSLCYAIQQDRAAPACWRQYETRHLEGRNAAISLYLLGEMFLEKRITFTHREAALLNCIFPKAIRTTIGAFGGVFASMGSIGYVCSNGVDIAKFRPHWLTKNLTVGLAMQFPPLFLGAKFGWNIFSDTVRFLFSLCSDQIHKPYIWQALGEYIIIPSLVVLISLFSGITSEIELEKNCDINWLTDSTNQTTANTTTLLENAGFFGKTSNSSTVFFNSICVFIGISTFLIGYLKRYGNNEKREFLLLTERLENIIKKISELDNNLFLLSLRKLQYSQLESLFPGIDQSVILDRLSPTEAEPLLTEAHSRGTSLSPTSQLPAGTHISFFPQPSMPIKDPSRNLFRCCNIL